MTTFPPLSGPDGTTRIPEKLPQRPAFGISAAPYLRLDGELVPPAFVRDVLRGLAGELLAAVDEAIILHSEPVPDGLRLVDPSLGLPRPSIVFAVTFADTNETVELAAHGLVWAATESPEFDAISTLLDSHPPPRFAPEHVGSHIALPCCPMRVPYFPAWQPLHDYVHDQSTEHLLEFLLHAPQEEDHRVPASTRMSDLLADRSQDVTRAEYGELIDKLERVRQLWMNAVALQIGDDGLWDTMALAWSTLVARATPDSLRP